MGRQSIPIYVLHIFKLPIFVRVVRLLPPETDWLLLADRTASGVAASLLVYRLLQWAKLDAALGLSGRLS